LKNTQMFQRCYCCC